jgi:hypothetical protein
MIDREREKERETQGEIDRQRETERESERVEELGAGVQWLRRESRRGTAATREEAI